MKRLAVDAVTVRGRERPRAAQPVLDGAAVASRRPLLVEPLLLPLVIVIGVDAGRGREVRRPALPPLVVVAAAVLVGGHLPPSPSAGHLSSRGRGLRRSDKLNKCYCCC